MPALDVYECNVDQTFAGQNMVNVLYFQQIGIDGTGDARNAITALWVVHFKDPHLELMVDSATIVQLRVRRVAPTQTQQLLFAVGVAGIQSGEAIPPQQCAILSQKGIRGGVKGRRGAGHMKISAVSVASVDTGRVNTAYAAKMNLLGVPFTQQITDGGSGYKFDSVILSPSDSVARRIISSGSTSRIRTVYSRSPGVGT